MMDSLYIAAIGRISRLVLAVVVFLAAASRSDGMGDGERGVLLLKNGQALSGKLAREGDRFLVMLPEGEIRVRVADVEHMYHTMDEVYAYKRDHIFSGRVEEHLSLADWCSRQGMPGHAAEELSAAIRIDPHHPRIAAMELALQQEHVRRAATPESDSKRDPKSAARNAASKPSNVPNSELTNEDLDRLTRNLPPGAMETFTTSIQPILLNGCTTSNCHGARSNCDFQLERLPLDGNVNPRRTQRNLHAVLSQIDRHSPGESPLLTVPLRAHGNLKTPLFVGRQSKLYQQLADWVTLVSQTESKSPVSRSIPQKEALEQTLGNYGLGPTKEDSSPSDETRSPRATAGIYVGHRPAELKMDKSFRSKDPRQSVAPGKKADRESAPKPAAANAESTKSNSIPPVNPIPPTNIPHAMIPNANENANERVQAK